MDRGVQAAVFNRGCYVRGVGVVDSRAEIRTVGYRLSPAKHAVHESQASRQFARFNSAVDH